MRIGIITYHKAINYGAFLQSYALTMTLRNKGFDAEIIDFNMKSAEENYKIKSKNILNRYYGKKLHKMFDEEQKKLPISKENLISDNIKEFNNFIKDKYDYIIAGSDEIWKVDSFRGFPTPYWLIGTYDNKKFSYAASSRSDFSQLSAQNLKIIKKTLNEFKLIGVRDACTYEEIKKIIDDKTKLQICCDPVFTYDFKINKELGRKLLKEKFGIKSNKKILGIMINDEKMAKEIRKQLNKDFELISLFRRWNGYRCSYNLTPFEWINVISALDILISNYFHGVCFSILGNTKFLAIDSREKVLKNGKIFDLLKRNKCLDYFLSTSYDNYIEKTIEFCKNDKNTINYSKIIKSERQLANKYFERFNGIIS